MRILYLSQSYLPSRRASGVAVMRMCEAFAACGHQIDLVGKAGDEGDVFAFYGVSRTFDITRVARPKWRGGELAFAAGVALEVVRRRRTIDLVYARDLVGAAFAGELGLPLVFEAHGVFERPWQRMLWRRMLRAPGFRGLVTISRAMVRELERAELLQGGVPVVVAHSPASASADEPRVTERVTRIGYVGSLYEGRGVELVVELAARMPELAFELVGGSEADVARWRSRVPPNLALRGFVPPAALPAVYREFDVLLMPYPRTGIVGATQKLDTANYCSPMKMFEYMASGVPIIASDLPVLQEVLVDGSNALIARADDVTAWQAALARLVREPAFRIELARNALRDLRPFTPINRVRQILHGLNLS